MVIGKTLDECVLIDVPDVAAYIREQLGDDAPGLRDACHALPVRPWAIEALHAAIAKYRSQPLVIDEELRGPLVCRCYGITEEHIREAVEEDGCTTVEAVQDETMAGRGCGSCRDDVERVVRELTDVPAAEPQVGGGLGRVAVLGQIHGVIAASGIADIEPWDLQGNTLVIRIHGDHDTEAQAGICARVQDAVRDDVDPMLTVVAG